MPRIEIWGTMANGQRWIKVGIPALSLILALRPAHLCPPAASPRLRVCLEAARGDRSMLPGHDLQKREGLPPMPQVQKALVRPISQEFPAPRSVTCFQQLGPKDLPTLVQSLIHEPKSHPAATTEEN
eukprot:s2812_g4.t1